MNKSKYSITGILLLSPLRNNKNWVWTWKQTELWKTGLEIQSFFQSISMMFIKLVSSCIIFPFLTPQNNFICSNTYGSSFLYLCLCLPLSFSLLLSLSL